MFCVLKQPNLIELSDYQPPKDESQNPCPVPHVLLFTVSIHLDNIAAMSLLFYRKWIELFIPLIGS